MGGTASQFRFTGVVARLDRNVGKVGKGLSVGKGGRLDGNVDTGKITVVVIVGIAVVVTGTGVVVVVTAAVVAVEKTIVDVALVKVSPGRTVMYGNGVVRYFWHIPFILAIFIRAGHTTSFQQISLKFILTCN